MKFLSNIGGTAKDVGFGIAGGSLGRVLTNKMGDKIPLVGSNPKLRPAGAFLLGLLIASGTKDAIHEGGKGMAIVAGTDVLGGYVPMVAHSMNDDLNGLGDELADTLEQRLADDVNSGKAAVNDDVNSGSAAVNDDINDEMNDEMNGEDD